MDEVDKHNAQVVIRRLLQEEVARVDDDLKRLGELLLLDQHSAGIAELAGWGKRARESVTAERWTHRAELVKAQEFMETLGWLDS
jgi:hypothetical protein